jgi:hypothetical protein
MDATVQAGAFVSRLNAQHGTLANNQLVWIYASATPDYDVAFRSALGIEWMNLLAQSVPQKRALQVHAIHILYSEQAPSYAITKVRLRTTRHAYA